MRVPGARSDEERRVAELQRVNEELAAELRSLTLERTGSPRRGALPASREIAKLRGRCDTLEQELEETRTELARVTAHREGLELQNQELALEVSRLSEGLKGLLRNLRARLNLRVGGGAGRGTRER
jgi:chromosome segregation ATPase